VGYKKGIDREQVMLLPERVEDYVSEDNPVRLLDAFVESLNMEELGVVRAKPKEIGRPSYDPRDLLRVFIYGYLNRIRSSRRLEAATGNNLEVIWLLGKLRPDHKTISEFRRHNAKVFKKVLREFNLLCRSLDLFGAELVGIDGTHIKAVNSRSRNFTKNKLVKLIGRIDAGIERYLEELERADEAERPGSGGAAGGGGSLAEKLGSLAEKKKAAEAMLSELEQKGESQRSSVDPESRSMKKKSTGQTTVGYNAQAALDEKHHLIVAAEVSNESRDSRLVEEMAGEAAEQLGVEQLKVVADGAYGESAALARCEARGMEMHVPRYADRQKNKGLFGRGEFTYGKDEDHYTCPAGQRLTLRSQYRSGGKQYAKYYNIGACAGCALRARCTKGKYRKIERGEHEGTLEKIAGRMRASPEVYAKRKELAEHPFGTIKFWWGQGAFLTRGLEMVRGEWSLSALAYNMRRVLNILTAEQLRGLVAALRGAGVKPVIA
jgi:transposase